jgi:hypothetical protein
VAYLRLEAQDDDVMITLASPTLRKDFLDDGRSSAVSVQFYIKPAIHLDDSMTIELFPEFKEMTDISELTVRQGQVVVIGGIFQEQEVDFDKKFPVLGDLPLLGLVFRSKNSTIMRIEHIIFLIPQVNGDEAASPLPGVS